MDNSFKPFDYQSSVAQISDQARIDARVHQSQLTKPQGSLGELEQIAVQFAGWQGCVCPELKVVSLRVFAGDHGVCAKGVSAFPQIVTQQMIHNFCSGGAAISVLAKEQAFDFQVWNMGTITAMPEMDSLVNKQIAHGTADFSEQVAMSDSQLQQCMQSGADAVPDSADLFIGGEMGIGNTTSASALMAALYDLDAAVVTGRGTGLDDKGVEQKTKIINQALTKHQYKSLPTLEKLRCFGGLEIAALVGAYISSAQKGIPVLVDGFISSVAAAYAVGLNASVRDWLIFAHCSAEHAHQRLLQELNARPVLQLGMRLGEASGAATAVPLLKLALSVHAGMATFAGAGVSGSDNNDADS